MTSPATKIRAPRRAAAVLVFLSACLVVPALAATTFKISKLIFQPGAIELRGTDDEHRLIVTAITSADVLVRL